MNTLRRWVAVGLSGFAALGAVLVDDDWHVSLCVCPTSVLQLPPHVLVFGGWTSSS